MALFGATVHVTVNRPLRTIRTESARYGARIHKHPYPLNGGYVTLSDFVRAGLISQAQARHIIVPPCEDMIGEAPLCYVYILGVDMPVTSFEGRIIAVVHRETAVPPLIPSLPLGRYDRLVLAPAGIEFYEPQIRAAVAFAERRFRYRLFCMYEKSCGAVVYTIREDQPLYLLIRNRSGHIGFPKGHVEYGEDERATMKREIAEETALRVEPDLRFREEYRYVLWGVVHKRAVYSLAQFQDGQPVTTMVNEIFGDWLLPYEEARKLLSYENDRDVLDRAHRYLQDR